jgi:ParB family chromosome partitioning protein
MSRQRERALGRGLEALIPVNPDGAGGISGGAGIPQYIDVDQVVSSPEQTRRLFPAEQIRELADSIRQHGLLQPVLVGRVREGYELIAGERRWRAARLAGLQRIPAIVRSDGSRDNSLILGLIENLQREDLNPIEAALGIQRLVEHFGLTHEQAATRLGKHRVAISQSLRLLSACPAVISATRAGATSAGHARALLALPTREAQELGLKVVLARHLSVRQTERWVKDHTTLPRGRKARASTADASGEGVMEAVRQQLRDRFGSVADVRGTRNRGAIVLAYGSAAELDGLLGLLLD